MPFGTTARRDNEWPFSAEMSRDGRMISGCYVAFMAETEAASTAKTSDGERLKAADEAFSRGDYAEVRRLSQELAKAEDAEVAAAASDLLRRVSIDPVQIGVVVACAFFFLWVSWKYIGS